jgi:hypothetical protein
MAVLTWDKPGDHLFETGVSKGVLYLADGSGVSWNGLTAIDEKVYGAVEPVYFDGVKFNDIVTISQFQGTIKAFTYPEEFAFCEGTLEDQTGFFIKNQSPSRFGLSYQTVTGDDINGLYTGYKIHVLYNLIALPSDRNRETISDTINPVDFEWEVTAIPEEIENFRPTAHIVFDSRKMDPHLLRDIESILYGDENGNAYLPSLKGLSSFIRKWDRLIIINNGNGTWTASSEEPDVITMLDEDTFQIVSDTAEYIDAYTYTISSSDKNEEDIWLP